MIVWALRAHNAVRLKDGLVEITSRCFISSTLLKHACELINVLHLSTSETRSVSLICNLYSQ